MTSGRDGRLRSLPSRSRRVVATLESKPENATHWVAGEWPSGRAVAVGRAHLAGVRPQAASRETFKLSTDPFFVEKVRDVVGLYLHPPERAIVLSVDEKSQVQALDRTQPIFPMTPGQPERGPTTTCGTGSPPCSPP